MFVEISVNQPRAARAWPTMVHGGCGEIRRISIAALRAMWEPWSLLSRFLPVARPLVDGPWKYAVQGLLAMAKRGACPALGLLFLVSLHSVVFGPGSKIATPYSGGASTWPAMVHGNAVQHRNSKWVR